MERILRRWALTCSSALLVLLQSHAGARAQDQGVDVTIVADQVRSQGYSCDNPTSAERIASESSPERPVYFLKCENTNYRVVLVPDQAADVTQIK